MDLCIVWPSKADQILRKTVIAAANQGLVLGLARLMFVQFMTLLPSCPGFSFQRQMPELGGKSAERRKTAGRLHSRELLQELRDGARCRLGISLFLLFGAFSPLFLKHFFF